MNLRVEAWFDEPKQVVEFGRALVQAGELDVNDVLSFVERPWQWDAAFQAWSAAGRPKSFEVPR